MHGLPNSKFYGDILISNQLGKTPCFNKVHHLVKAAPRYYYYHIIYSALSVGISLIIQHTVFSTLKKKIGRKNSVGTSKGMWLSWFTLPPPKKKSQRRLRMLQRSSLKNGFSVTKVWWQSFEVNKLLKKFIVNQLMCAVERQVPLVRHTHCELSQKAGGVFRICYSRGPQPLGHGPVWVHGLIGTGPHSRKLAAGKTEIIAHPHAWKNCLARNQFLVPERLGTAVLQHTTPLAAPQVNSNIRLASLECTGMKSLLLKRPLNLSFLN